MNYKGVYRTAPATPGLLVMAGVIASCFSNCRNLSNRPGVARAVLQTPLLFIN